MNLELEFIRFFFKYALAFIVIYWLIAFLYKVIIVGVFIKAMKKEHQRRKSEL